MRPPATGLGRAGLSVILAALLLAGLGRSVPAVLARMTATELVSATFSTETLDPPTSLVATAALVLRVDLTWTATVDLRATGYRVLRATTSGGPYTEVATVAPAAATSYQDTVPVPGQYFYVLRTYIGAWTSGSSNEASVIVV